MNVDIVKKEETSQVELTISVPEKDFAPFLTKAAQKLSKEKPMKGFRPGKAPVKAVAEHVGHELLLQEAMDGALPHFFVQAAIDNNVDAINRPNITIKELAFEKPFEFTATVDVMPSVTLGDLKKVSVKKKDVEVTDKQMEKELDHIRKTRSTFIDVARPAEKDDILTVDFQILIDGEVIEGGESKNHPITIGEGRFIPDFEKNIVGMQADDDRVFEVAFPDDYPAKQLKGKKAEAKVHAHSVQKRVVPDLNDDFAKGLGGKFTDVDHLKKELKENMQKEMEGREQEKHLSEIAQKYAEESTFGHIPDILVEKEIDNRLHELSHMLSHQKKSIDDYIEAQGTTLEEMRGKMREAAITQVKVGLTIREFANTHDVQVDKKEIEEEVNKQLEQYKTTEQAEQEIDPDELREHVASTLRNRKTLETLAAKAGK